MKSASILLAKFGFKTIAFAALFLIFLCCKIEANSQNKKEVTAKDILGNNKYQAISFGGYRENSREIQPTVAQLKEDLSILAAMNIKVIRTYNVHLVHASNVLVAISELKK